jgi:hypothetical protein
MSLTSFTVRIWIDEEVLMKDITHPMLFLDESAPKMGKMAHCAILANLEESIMFRWKSDRGSMLPCAR